MKRLLIRRYKKFLLPIVILTVISGIVGFVSPEYENIKAKIAVHEGIKQLESVSQDNLWKQHHFVSEKPFLAVTKINGLPPIKSISSSNIGISALDFNGKTRFLTPIGIIGYETELTDNTECVVGKNGIICYTHGKKDFSVLSKRGKKIVFHTAGTVNTAFTANGNEEYLSVGTNAKRLWLVQMNNKKYSYQKKRLPGGPIYSCIMDNNLVMLCVNDNCIFSWNPETDRTHIINMPAGLFENMTCTQISELGFLLTDEKKALVIDKNGKLCFVLNKDTDVERSYFTSPIGKYLGIIDHNILKGHGKDIQDGSAACYDLTTGKKKWSFDYLLDSNKLIGILDNGDAICYNSSKNLLLRRSSENGTYEKIAYLSGPIHSLVRNSSVLYILSGGNIWSIRQIVEYR